MCESVTQPLPHSAPRSDLFPLFHTPSTPSLHPSLHSTTQDPPSSHTTLHSTNNFAGDPLIKQDDDITRLVFGNVNGLQLGDKGHRLDSICKDIQAMEADLVGLAETNIDDTKFEVNQTIHSAMKQNFHHYSIASHLVQLHPSIVDIQTRWYPQPSS
jgi:hypothetical protein